MENVYHMIPEDRIQPMAERVTEPALSVDELRTNLTQAEELIAQYRTRESNRIVSQLLRHPLPEEVRVLLHESQSKFRRYQDDEAAIVLREAVNALGGEA